MVHNIIFTFYVHILTTIGNARNNICPVLYCYKFWGHGTTPCPQMMKALSLSQSQGISYEVTHNHLNRFLWAHHLHDDTIKHLKHHCHPVQLLPGIHVWVTLHQRYIRVHLEGFISGVHMLLHQFSHHHRIFRYKLLPLHPYTPWRSTAPLEKLKSSAEG